MSVFLKLILGSRIPGSIRLKNCIVFPRLSVAQYASHGVHSKKLFEKYVPKIKCMRGGFVHNNYF